MAEIEEECIFETSPLNVVLRTQVNGDRLEINTLHFTKEQAASLAWILNNTSIKTLEIQIKEKT